MRMRVSSTWFEIPRARLSSKVLVFVFLILLGALSLSSVNAQQRLSKRYPTGKNVRIELKNISGTITVESWNRDEVKLTATLESPKANLVPRQTSDALIVDVRADNRGRSDVGNVNFNLQVPINSSVDLETMRGQITVTNIHGGMVRAHVSSEGDIELSGITASQVYAQNTIGNIFFDGEFARGGTYHFQSSKGDITIRIPADSAFNLEAAAPNKKIALGQFWNKDIKSLGNGRKYVGDVVDGRSKVMVTNFQGSITFIRR
jgi:putative adhesin